MADPTCGVVEHLGRGEGLVTALVGQNPQASAKQTLDDRIQSPEGGAKGRRGDIFGGYEGVEEDKGGSETGHIPSDI